MDNENLLATYSLLSYIREHSVNKENKSILMLFIPLLKETLNRMLRRANAAFKGKDYTEIQNAILDEFCIQIPIPVIEILIKEVSKETEGAIVLYGDHSFIINSECVTTVAKEYEEEKKRIKRLANNYKIYCESHGVEDNFEELIAFIQDQKNRIFENKVSTIHSQDYHISKYIDRKLKDRDECYETICNIYLGGVITSYFTFHISSKIVDVELLIDTNFYISLINLNTEEAYIACKQLFELTIRMGYRFSILETTIEQIKILLSNRIKRYNSKDLFASLNVADVLSASARRQLQKTDLERYKDNLTSDLAHKGIQIVYNNNIKELHTKTQRSNDLKKLSIIRGNRESAFNDLLAQEYVAYRRRGKTITEFNDVNCWFLNNSFSVNWKEKDIPVWERKSITASDLLLLLWLSNPSLSLGKEGKMLAITSLSANVINYRSQRYPSYKIISQLQEKVASMQNQGNITEAVVAKLCIRMAEGAIDETEGRRLLTLSTDALKSYLEDMSKRDDAYMKIQDELSLKNDTLEQMKIQLKNKEAEASLFRMRLYGVVYVIFILVMYFVGVLYIPFLTDNWNGWLVQFIYWLLSTVLVNWINHNYFRDGLISFICKKKIMEKLLS